MHAAPISGCKAMHATPILHAKPSWGTKQCLQIPLCVQSHPGVQSNACKPNFGMQSNTCNPYSACHAILGCKATPITPMLDCKATPILHAKPSWCAKQCMQAQFQDAKQRLQPSLCMQRYPGAQSNACNPNSGLQSNACNPNSACNAILGRKAMPATPILCAKPSWCAKQCMEAQFRDAKQRLQPLLCMQRYPGAQSNAYNPNAGLQSNPNSACKAILVCKAMHASPILDCKAMHVTPILCAKPFWCAKQCMQAQFQDAKQCVQPQFCMQNHPGAQSNACNPNFGLQPQFRGFKQAQQPPIFTPPPPSFLLSAGGRRASPPPCLHRLGCGGGDTGGHPPSAEGTGGVEAALRRRHLRPGVVAQQLPRSNRWNLR